MTTKAVCASCFTQHVVHAHPPVAAAACQLGAAQQAATCLASSDDDTWQAALLLIQQVGQYSQTLGQLTQVSYPVKLTTKPFLSDVVASFRLMVGNSNVIKQLVHVQLRLTHVVVSMTV